MAEEQETDQDHSIEEILASIRQIISDDEEEEGKPEAESDSGDSEPEQSAVEEVDDDVVELTDKVEDDSGEDVTAEPADEEALPEESVEFESAPEPEPAPEPESEPEPEPEAEPEPESESEPESPPAASGPESVEVDMRNVEEEETQEDVDEILTQDAEEAVYEGFSELARKTAVEHNGITLEEIVRTELRPLMREWLDKNLPSIVERLVQEELERVARRAVGD